LPELAKKPQAVRQVADELIRDLGTPFDVLWRQLKHRSVESSLGDRVVEPVFDLGQRDT
jgi:hypothetical protein